MKKTAIVGSLCGNYTAVQALDADMKQQGVQEIICLGNMISWGPNPIDVIRWVMSNCSCCLSSYAEIASYNPDILTGFGRKKMVSSILENSKVINADKECQSYIQSLETHAVYEDIPLLSNCFSRGTGLRDYALAGGIPNLKFSDIESGDFSESVNVENAYSQFDPWSLIIWEGPGMHWWIDVNACERKGWIDGLQIPYSNTKQATIGGLVSGGWEGRRFADKASYVILEEDLATLRIIHYDNSGLNHEV